MSKMQIGKHFFDFNNKSYIMGILNVTPDSFSDGGTHNKPEDALFHVEKMIREGAAIIDVGGESTRPGYEEVSEEEEIARTVPVIREIVRRFDVPVSIDTCKSAVAEAALEAGAGMVNDIRGFLGDERLAELTARTGAACCLMHSRPLAPSTEISFEQFMEDVLRDLEESLEKAEKAGVKRDRILLDPGIGFGKDYRQNLYLLCHLDRLCELGYPVLLGTSRKSVIGLTLDLPVDQRLEGTIATTVQGRMKGASVFRVHDVKENDRALRMADAVLAMEKPDHR